MIENSGFDPKFLALQISNYLNAKQSSDSGNYQSILKALKILGESNVITADEAAKAWNCWPPDIPVHYDEKTLLKCAEDNQQKLADWILIYINGFSLREQRRIIGVNRNTGPCFEKSSWWLEKKESVWANEKVKSGYYLIDFKLKFGGLNWAQQEEKIAELGKEFQRVHEAVIAEALFTIHYIFREKRLENDWHWGKNPDSIGHRIVIGHFDSDGLHIGDRPSDFADVGCLKVCILRSPSF